MADLAWLPQTAPHVGRFPCCRLLPLRNRRRLCHRSPLAPVPLLLLLLLLPPPSRWQWLWPLLPLGPCCCCCCAGDGGSALAQGPLRGRGRRQVQPASRRLCQRARGGGRRRRLRALALVRRRCSSLLLPLLPALLLVAGGGRRTLPLNKTHRASMQRLAAWRQPRRASSDPPPLLPPAPLRSAAYGKGDDGPKLNLGRQLYAAGAGARLLARLRALFNPQASAGPGRGPVLVFPRPWPLGSFSWLLPCPSACTHGEGSPAARCRCLHCYCCCRCRRSSRCRCCRRHRCCLLRDAPTAPLAR